MTDPRQNVRSGQQLAIAAEQINWINRQMRGGGGHSSTEAAAVDRASNIVLIRNNSGVTVPQVGVLGISGVAIDPSGGTLFGADAASARARSFAERPVLVGNIPSIASHGNAFAVTLEPIGIGKIGRAAIGGCFACLVYVTDPTHGFATVKDGDVTQLQSARCGVLQLVWKQSGFGECKWAAGVM
jgi:hypothetical protein